MFSKPSRYEVFRGDDNLYFINHYTYLDEFTCSRETIYSDIPTEKEADRICAMLTEAEKYLHD